MENHRIPIVLSVNVGQPQSYTLNDVTIETSMVRHSVDSIQVSFDQVIGDQFKNAQYHGTRDAVVYALSQHRFEYWEKYLNKKSVIGLFGENLTLDFLDESLIFLGDCFEIGTTVLKATGPRYPCNKLNYVTGVSTMMKEFENQNWPGVYFEVLNEGVIKPSDQLKLVQRSQNKVSVLDLYKAMRNKKRNVLDEHLTSQFLNLKELHEKYLKRI